MAIRNHYLPQFLLRGFTDDDGLWQFDIHNGNFERRSVENAGQRRHFYTDELERGLLQRVDGKAAAVFAQGFTDSKGELSITAEDRIALANWLGLFGMRGPQTLEFLKTIISGELKKPEIAVKIVAELIQKRSSELFPDLIDDIGKEAGDKIIMDALVPLIEQGKLNYMPDAKMIFDDFINEPRMQRYATTLLGFHWVWLYSEHGFIIGDNPLCRWNDRFKKWNCGLNSRGTELTFPLSNSLCLRLQRQQPVSKGIVHCNRDLSRAYNYRQMISSVYNVYGPKCRLQSMAASQVGNALSAGRLRTPPRFRP